MTCVWLPCDQILFPSLFFYKFFGSLFFLIRNEWKQNMRCSFSSVHKSIIMKLINPFGLLCLSFHSNWVIFAGFFQWMVISIIILLSYRLATDLRHRKWWPPWSPYIDRSCIREFRSAITSTFTSSFFIHKRLSVGVEHFSFSGFHERSRGILKIKWSEAEYFPTSAACEPIHGEMVGRKLYATLNSIRNGCCGRSAVNCLIEELGASETRNKRSHKPENQGSNTRQEIEMEFSIGLTSWKKCRVNQFQSVMEECTKSKCTRSTNRRPSTDARPCDAPHRCPFPPSYYKSATSRFEYFHSPFIS